MPSEQRADLALAAVGASVDGFRSAVARAVDEVRGELERRRQPAEAGARTEELGALAARCMDPERFGALLGRESVLDPEATSRLEAAHEALAAMDAADDRTFVETVREGRSLYDTVETGLTRLGAAFGAARIAELAREGRHGEEVDAEQLAAFPPALWNRAERRLAPPLILETPGRALRAGALADFLDGAQKLVLVVEGDAPPAPLARLITPGVLVLQTEDPSGLERVAAFDGPAVAAVFPEGSGAARFVHDPAAGQNLGERLVVEELPEAADLRPVGSISVFQQAEEVAQLAALARPAEGAVGPSTNGSGTATHGSGKEAEPADRLAAWLLRQANLRDVG